MHALRPTACIRKWRTPVDSFLSIHGSSLFRPPFPLDKNKKETRKGKGCMGRNLQPTKMPPNNQNASNHIFAFYCATKFKRNAKTSKGQIKWELNKQKTDQQHNEVMAHVTIMVTIMVAKGKIGQNMFVSVLHTRNKNTKANENCSKALSKIFKMGPRWFS